MFWNSKDVHSKDKDAFNAHSQTAFEWFRVSKCFDNIRDHRTYAQVIKTSLPKQGHVKGIHSRYLRPRIVTVNNENSKVKPKVVTPSKVSINAQGCTPSHNTRFVNKRVSNHGFSPLAQQKGFLSNRFDVLMKLSDSSIDRYTEERVDDGVQSCKDSKVLSKTDNVQTPLKATKNYVNAIQASNRSVKNFVQSPHHKEVENMLQCYHTEEKVQDIPHALHENASAMLSFMNKTSRHVQKQDTPHSLVEQEKFPLYVWKNKQFSTDYTACIDQNGGELGYIPLQNLKLYEGPPVFWEKVPDILQAHKIIRQSGVPVYQ